MSDANPNIYPHINPRYVPSNRKLGAAVAPNLALSIAITAETTVANHDVVDVEVPASPQFTS